MCMSPLEWLDVAGNGRAEMFIKCNILGNYDVGGTDAIFDVDETSCLLGRQTNKHASSGRILDLLFLSQSASRCAGIVSFETDGATKYAQMAHRPNYHHKYQCTCFSVYFLSRHLLIAIRQQVASDTNFTVVTGLPGQIVVIARPLPLLTS